MRAYSFLKNDNQCTRVSYVDRFVCMSEEGRTKPVSPLYVDVIRYHPCNGVPKSPSELRSLSPKILQVELQRIGYPSTGFKSAMALRLHEGLMRIAMSGDRSLGEKTSRFQSPDSKSTSLNTTATGSPASAVSPNSANGDGGCSSTATTKLQRRPPSPCRLRTLRASSKSTSDIFDFTLDTKQSVRSAHTCPMSARPFIRTALFDKHKGAPVIVDAKSSLRANSDTTVDSTTSTVANTTNSVITPAPTTVTTSAVVRYQGEDAGTLPDEFRCLELDLVIVEQRPPPHAFYH